MKRIAIFALLILAACSTTNYPVTPPDVEIVQIYGPSNLDFSPGVSHLDAKYGSQIKANPSDPITLKHVARDAVGGTLILLRHQDRPFNNVVPLGLVGRATMHARGYFSRDMSGSPTREPLTVRATLHFDSPKGSFNKIVQRNIGQFPGQ